MKVEFWPAPIIVIPFVMVTCSVYVPASTLIISLAAAVFTANCKVANGAAAVPGLALLPVAVVNISPVVFPSFT